jgi:hypothetical protein
MAATHRPVKESVTAARGRPRDCGQRWFGVYSVTGNPERKWFMTKRLVHKKRPRERANRFHTYLRRLRAGGRSNMYGAIPYLMQSFELDRESAFRIVCEWVDQQAEEAEATRQSSSRR